jgi:hypothetical protein
MKQRIKDLMPQAYELVRERNNGYFTQELLLECMAELVMKECASICRENGDTYEHSFTPAKARLAKSTSYWCAKLIDMQL